jgi:hypothetical protein
MAVQITGSQIKNNEISADKLQSNSVTAAKIQSAAVTTAKIANFAVGSSQLSNGSVISGKIATGAVSAAACDLTQTWDFGSGNLRAGTPSASNDVATKNYVDSAVSSDIYWKEPVRVASTANIDLSSAPAAIDGVTLSTDDRILVKDQSTASQNGLYQFAGSGSAMSRTSDCDSAAEINGAAVFVKEGTTNADQGFVQTSEVVSLGSDSVSFVQFTGLGQITAGNGLDKSGNTLSVDTGAGLQIISGAVAVETGSALFIDSNAVAVSVDDSSIEVNGSNQLQVRVDGITSAMIGTNQVTGNEIAGSTVGTANLADSAVTSVKLGASSVSAVKIASNAVTSDKLQSNAVTEAKISTSVAGDGLSGGNGAALSVNVDDSTIEIDTDTLQLRNLGVSTAKLQDNCVQTAKIANDAVDKTKIHSDVAGNGLAQDGTGALEVSVGDGLEIFSDTVNIKNGAALDFNGGSLDVQVDDSTIEIDENSNELGVRNLGITSAKLQDNCVQTAKIQDDAVTFQKSGWRMYQELSTISGSSTTTIDLARALDANAVNGVMVYKNGLALLNQTALSGSAANNDEFSVSADGGAGSVARLTFGSALADSDSILVWYLT